MFNGSDTSSMKPGSKIPTYHISEHSKIRVVQQEGQATEQPWLELSVRNLRIYPCVEYIELSEDEGAHIRNRLFLRCPAKKAKVTMRELLRALCSVGPTLVEEGVPDEI